MKDQKSSHYKGQAVEFVFNFLYPPLFSLQLQSQWDLTFYSFEVITSNPNAPMSIYCTDEAKSNTNGKDDL